MMQLGERIGDEGGEAGVVSTKGKDVAAAATNSKQLKRSLNAGDQLVPGALPKPTTPLPCPRCESLNTKFCYYNNYSVTQPRHFCRQCQRYWTAGGTLRNVPVGGGSRKKSRHSQRPLDQLHHQPAAYGVVPGSTFMHQQQQQQQPLGSMNPMAGVGGGFASPQQLGFQHLMQQQQPAAPDMTGFSFAAGMIPGMHGGSGVGSMYGAAADPAMVALPLQMRPAGGENSNLNPHVPAAPKPEFVENNNVDHVVGVKMITKNGSSSSTIEEEGSTPTNRYSSSGYVEEGDAVSSMWHEMHDMDNVLFQ